MNSRAEENISRTYFKTAKEYIIGHKWFQTIYFETKSPTGEYF